MNNLIKKIKAILGDHESSVFSIHVSPTEIWFEIYDSRVVINIDKKQRYAYADFETYNKHLTADMLIELGEIVKLIENNIDLVLDCIEDKRKM
jgi:hypothetical protein